MFTLFLNYEKRQPPSGKCFLYHSWVILYKGSSVLLLDQRWEDNFHTNIEIKTATVDIRKHSTTVKK